MKTMHPLQPHTAGRYARQLETGRAVLRAEQEADLRQAMGANAREASFSSLRRLRTPDDPPTPSGEATRAFEAAVARGLKVGHGALDRTARQHLIRAAADLGLDRFDAHLLMARVEHYAAPRGRSRSAAGGRRRGAGGVLLAGGMLLLGVQGALVWFWLKILS